MEKIFAAVRKTELIGASVRKGSQHLGLRDTQVLVLAVIGGYPNEGSEGWHQGMPSAAAVSAHTGFQRSTVAQSLKMLVHRGFVEPVRMSCPEISVIYLPLYRLTPEGARVFPYVRDLLASVEHSVFAPTGDERSPARRNALEQAVG